MGVTAVDSEKFSTIPNIEANALKKISLVKKPEDTKRPYLPKGSVENFWNRTQMERRVSCILAKGRCIISLTISQTHPFYPENCSPLAPQEEFKNSKEKYEGSKLMHITP